MFGACKSKDQISANVTWYCFNLSLYCVRGVLIHTSIISLWLSCLGPPPLFWLYCSQRFLNYLAFQSFDIERTWWRLFWAYLMKVIQAERTWWRLFRLSVPDEGYSAWAYLMKVILSVADEGYWAYLMKVIQADRTWWRLFQKRVVCTKCDIYASTSLSLYCVKWCHNSYIFENISNIDIT